MKTLLAWMLSLLLAGCGGSALDQTAQTSGSGGARPAGGLCPDVTVTSVSCTPNNYHDPLVSFVADSSLIFLGTVAALNTTTAGIDATDTSRMIVVHVDAVLLDGGMLDLGGQQVTIELLAAPTMAVGYQGYFFTDLWTVGQSVGVTEVAHVDPGVYPTLATDVPGIEQLLADEKLYARMETAATVVVGTVTAVTALPDTGPASEHDPLWADATVTVDCALRGATPGAAHVAFATSDDVAWASSPKLAAGEAGVFLLQPAPSPPGTWPLPATTPYVVPDPLDVQPSGERAHLADLVLCPPGD